MTFQVQSLKRNLFQADNLIFFLLTLEEKKKKPTVYRQNSMLEKAMQITQDVNERKCIP